LSHRLKLPEQHRVIEEVLEIIAIAELEDVDAGALFCDVEEGHEYSLAVLNHEVNFLFIGLLQIDY
jgi:hypothetical protein